MSSSTQYTMHCSLQTAYQGAGLFICEETHSMQCTALCKQHTRELDWSFVLSRLDYCNATLAGLPDTHIVHPQRIQNNAARLVLQKSKRQHVTLLLKPLHWLPIQTRIDYKLATLAFRHFDGSLPQYLSLRLDHPDHLDQAMTGFSGFHVGNRIFQVRVFQLPRTFGTLFPMISNSRLPWPPLNPN